MYIDRVREHGESKLAARRQVGALLNPATLRNWVEREQINTGARRVVTVSSPPRSRPCAGRTPSCGAPMRSSRGIGVTADSSDHRLHRRPQGPVRWLCRSAGAVRAWDADRPEHLPSRAQDPSQRPRANRGLPRRRRRARFPRPPRDLGVTHAVAPAAPRRSRVGRDQVGRLMRIIDRAWGTPTRPDQWWVAEGHRPPPAGDLHGLIRLKELRWVHGDGPGNLLVSGVLPMITTVGSAGVKVVR